MAGKGSVGSSTRSPSTTSSRPSSSSTSTSRTSTPRPTRPISTRNTSTTSSSQPAQRLTQAKKPPKTTSLRRDVKPTTTTTSQPTTTTRGTTPSTTTVPGKPTSLKRDLKAPTTTTDPQVTSGARSKGAPAPSTQKTTAADPKTRSTKQDAPATPVTPQTLNNLKSKDPKVRGAAVDSLTKAAANGDPQALQQLQKSLGETDTQIALDYKQREALQRSVAEGLAKAAKNGDPTAVQGLTQSLNSSDSDTRRVAQTALADAARGGDANALAALRKEAASDHYTGGPAAANALSQLPAEQLTPQDYQLMARHGLNGNSSGEPARKALVQAAKDGRPGAMDALRAPLSEQGTSYDVKRRQQEAAEALAQVPERVTDADVNNLHRLATNSDDQYLRQDAFEAIAGAAGRQPPSARAQQAIADIADRIHASKGQYDPRSLDDPYGNIRRDPAFREAMGNAFEKATSPEIKERLAPHILRNELNNNQRLQDAVKTLEPKALAGDKDTLRHLTQHLSESRGGNGNGHTGQVEARRVLEQAAQNGHAGEIADQLMQQYRSAGNNDRGRGLETLGEVARHLPANDPKLNDIRKTLRDGVSTPVGSDRFGRYSAERGMRAMADRLQWEDINALVQNNNAYNAETLAKAAQTMNPTDRDALRTDLRGQLGDNMRGDDAAKAMAGMSQHLQREDVEALQQRFNNTHPNYRQPYADAMRSVLDNPEGNLGAQNAAARSFLDAPKENIRPEDFNSVVNFASRGNDQGLKQELLGRLPNAPITNEHLERVAKNYGQTVQSYLKHARPGSDWHKMAQLLTAQQMAKDPKWRDHVNLPEVQRQINNLANGPLQDDLARIRDRSIRRNVSRMVPEEQEKYLGSDAFQQRLKLLSPEQRQATLAREIGNLRGLDPAAAQRATDKLAGQALQSNAADIFRSMKGDPKQQASALQAALQNVAKGTSVTAGTTNKLVGLLNSMDNISDPTRVGQRLVEGLEQAQDAARKAGNVQELAETSRALDLVKNLNSRGQLSTVLAGASLLGLTAGGVPKNAEEWAGAASSVMGTLGDASEIGKLFRISDATKLGQGLKMLEPLGPIGDLLGAGVDAYGSYKDFSQGDYVGGGAKAVGAGAGLAGAAAGAAILAGASGPAAPAVLLGAALVGLGAWGVDALWGKSNEQSFLENLGAWKG